MLERVVKFANMWSSSLPGNLERLSCILMAIFLFFAVMTVQMYKSLLHKYQIRSRIWICSKPSTMTEIITFECHVKLLFLAWIGSMLLAWFILACHFLYCGLIYIWTTNSRKHQLSSTETQSAGSTGEKMQHQQLSSIVTDSDDDDDDDIHSELDEKKVN